VSTPPDQPLVPPSNPEPAPADPWAAPGPKRPTEPHPASPTAAGYPTASGYPPASGYADPPWPQQPPTAWGAPPYAPTDTNTDTDSGAALRKARTALGWAVGAAAGAFLAMLLAVGALLATAVSSGDDFSYEPLRSQVDGLTAGGALAGDTLEGPLGALLREVGSSDVSISCPDVAQVRVSTSVVCTGDVDGSAWTGIVFFEDDGGTFVVLEV
jgi:hypothetical protein